MFLLRPIKKLINYFQPSQASLQPITSEYKPQEQRLSALHLNQLQLDISQLKLQQQQIMRDRQDLYQKILNEKLHIASKAKFWQKKTTTILNSTQILAKEKMYRNLDELHHELNKKIDKLSDQFYEKFSKYTDVIIDDNHYITKETEAFFMDLKTKRTGNAEVLYTISLTDTSETENKNKLLSKEQRSKSEPRLKLENPFSPRRVTIGSIFNSELGNLGVGIKR